MGKDLKGRELGVGISQRPDGLYTARFTNKKGKRVQKYFSKLQECRKWLADAQYACEHNDVLYGGVPTVNAWFNFWIDSIKGENIKYNTRTIYRNRYKFNIEPYVGDMLINEIRPLHCQNILNNMTNEYSDESIQRTRTVLKMLFESAVENEIIIKNPITKGTRSKSKKQTKIPRVLTIEEQKIFLQSEKEINDIYYNQFALLLQTGMRSGEMTGLRWQDIDFQNRKIHISRTMEYIAKKKMWEIGTPKTQNGNRYIPLTREAETILKEQKEKNRHIKVIPLEFADIVFLNKKGEPIKNTAYNEHIYKSCDKIGIKRFSMHTFRHTFATRCIENGMRPKTLQIILGHSNISITMDLYVHVTEDEEKNELESIEAKLKLV